MQREKDVEAQAILEQHEKSKLCIVCMDRNKETCLQPCRHKAMCETCSAAVTRCPVCRTPIEEVVKLIDA